MLIKQDSCRLNNTESFLYTVFCNVDKSMLIFIFYLFFALNIHRVDMQVSVDFLNDGQR